MTNSIRPFLFIDKTLFTETNFHTDVCVLWYNPDPYHFVVPAFVVSLVKFSLPVSFLFTTGKLLPNETNGKAAVKPLLLHYFWYTF